MSSADDQRDDRDDRRVHWAPHEVDTDGSSQADQADRETPPDVDGSRIAWLEELRGAVLGRMGVIPPVESGQHAVSDVEPAQQLPREFGKFQLLERIGVGGMGEVYRAVQPGTNRTIALKLVDLGSSRQVRERFLDEIQVVASLQHENIVTVLEGDEFDGQPYCAMELVDGQDLSRVIDGKPLAKGRVVGYGTQMAAAIEFAHQAGIVHRDLKPSNVLINRDDKVRVADFGLAKRLDDSTGLTVAGQILGTPAYMSPEQAQGDPKIDHRTDVYGIGAVIYEMLTGRAPFRAATHAATLQQVIGEPVVSPRRLNAAADRDLETICLKCLEKEPDRRYPTAREILEELQRVEQGVPIVARSATNVERAIRWAKRHPVTAALSSAVVVLLLTTGIVSAVAYAITERSHSEVEQQRRVTQETQQQEQAAQQAAKTATEKEAIARREAESAAAREAQATREAEDAAKERTRAEQIAEERRRALLRGTAELAVQRGMHEADQENYAAAVVWFAEALRNLSDFPDDQSDHRMRIANYRRFAPRMEDMIVHRRAMRLLAVSADGKFVATADSEVHLWDRATGRLTWKLRPVEFVPPTGGAADAMPGLICGMQFSGGSDWLVISCQVRRRLATNPPQFDSVTQVRLLDLKAKRPQTAWLECPSSSNVVAVSPDKRWLAAALAMPSHLPTEGTKIRPETLRAWSFDGETLPSTSEHTEALQAEWQRRAAGWHQKMTPESSIMVSFAAPANAHLAHADQVLFAVSSERRDLWVTSSEDRTVRLWTRPPTRQIDGDALIPVNVRLMRDSTAEIEADGLAFACDPAALLTRVSWPPEGRFLAAAPTSGATIKRAVFLRNGEMLLLAALDQLFVCDATTGNLLAATPEFDGFIKDVAVSPDESLIATATGDSEVLLWSVADLQPFGDPLLHPDDVVHIDFHPRGARLLTACEDGTARQWTIASAASFGKTLSGGGQMLRAWYTPDGQQIVTVNEEDGARLWDADTSQPRGTLRASGDDIHQVAVRPDRSAIYWASLLDETLRISRTFPRKTKGPPDRAPGDDLPGQALDMAKGPQDVHHDGEITSIAVSPDGRLVASSSADGTARVWDADTLAAHGPPLMHADYVAAVAFSPDSRYLATASWDGTARVWSLATGQPVTPPLPHDGQVRSVGFSPDGRTLATIDLAMTRLWDIGPDNRDVAEIISDAQWRACRSIDANGQLTPPDSSQFIRELRKRVGGGRGPEPYWVDLRRNRER